MRRYPTIAMILLDAIQAATLYMPATAVVREGCPPLPKQRHGGAVAHRKWKRNRASGRA